MDCISVNLKKVGHYFFKFTVCQFLLVSKCHYFTQLENLFSCYVVTILQMKDSWSANLTFRAHN